MSANIATVSRRDKYIWVLLIAGFCLLYLAFLGIRPLFIPDEVRYGEIAREMLASGDWIVPRLNGLLYFEKPPFGYWMNAMSILLFGENPFAVRFASTMAVGASAAAVFALGRAYFDSRYVACFAVFIFLTLFEVQAVGTFGVLDSMFSTFLNVGIALFAFAEMRSGRPRAAYLCGSGVFFGIAFLTKGFLGFVLPVLVIVPWLISRRQFHLLFRQSWLVIVVAVLIVAPWGIAIHAHQPDFWRYFFWVEHIQRFASEKAQHEAPIYYYMMYLPAVAFPWFFLVPAALTGLRRRDVRIEYPGGLTLLVIWAVVPFLFLSIASGKLITYILPCFVPASLIMAAGLARFDAKGRAYRYGIAAITIALAAGFVAVVSSLVAEDILSYSGAEWAKAVSLCVALVLSMLTLLHGMRTSDKRYRLLCPGVALGLILVTLPTVVPDVTLKRKAPVEFIRQVYAQVPGDAAVVTNGSLVRAVSWATRRSDIFVFEDGGEVRYGLESPGGEGRFLLSAELGDMLSTRKNVLVICKGQCRDESLNMLPKKRREWSYGNFFAYAVTNTATSLSDESDTYGDRPGFTTARTRDW